MTHAVLKMAGINVTSQTEELRLAVEMLREKKVLVFQASAG